MKKILLIVLAIMLSNCEISVRKSEAQKVSMGKYGYDLKYKDVYTGGMRYNIYSYSYRSLVVVNVTRDSLECLYYKNHQFKD